VVLSSLFVIGGGCETIVPAIVLAAAQLAGKRTTVRPSASPGAGSVS
jgi:hypothetical protein